MGFNHQLCVLAAHTLRGQMLAVLIVGALGAFLGTWQDVGLRTATPGAGLLSDFNMMCLAETHVVEFQFLIKT